jgi:hypothetical protein
VSGFLRCPAAGTASTTASIKINFLIIHLLILIKALKIEFYCAIHIFFGEIQKQHPAQNFPGQVL